ncbi:hypothetical protein [Chamaesiphon sp. VAR_69_metabat_338]|uniref:hypothetical protein n=1 Tax=Chamaesiphon sp. VAR_69_metabat_338 TaxID=2964704 RepID=UPI00286E2110|nr:hypothetical protein [Chamaesiphon sp. VAR_69_metabat_338]
MTKLTNIIDKLGDSNPQIFRELKERLTVRNITLAIVCAAIVQGLVLLYFNGQIPVPTDEALSAQKLGVHSSYCLVPPSSGYDESYCRLSPNGGFIIDWQKWWLDIFTCLAWILPFGLILGSVYTLVADLVREEKRGTLNFIRLSPQSAQTIFSGKIIGVPSLIYLAIAAILPLHFIAGMNAGGNITLLLSWDLAIGALAFLLASATVLYVLLGGVQAILSTIAIGYPLWMPLMAINTVVIRSIERDGDVFGIDALRWFGLPIASNALLFYAFEIGTCSIASYWIWQVLERRYLAPTATIVGKFQSYRLNLCWQIWIAGFAVSAILSSSGGSYVRESAANWFAAIDFAVLLLLIPTLLPSKQALQDWSRYRRERVTHPQRKFWQRELMTDLIGNDKSPALLAVVINLGMALVLWLPLSFFAFARLLTGFQFAVSICIAASLIAIYAAIAHLALFFNFKQRKVWIIGSIGGAMFLPMVGAFVLSSNHTPTGLAATLLVFSPLASIGIPQLPIGALVASILTQLGIFAFLTRQLQRKLQQSGQSQTNRLAADRAI